jgi:hypothetical protein
MAITKLNNISWSSISKVDGIAKASISKVSGIEAVSGPPIQYVDLNATKYGTYNKYSTVDWNNAINSINADTTQTTSLNVASAANALRSGGVGYVNNRTYVQFDLSSLNSYTILTLALNINVTGITTATNNSIAVKDAGQPSTTISYPTLAVGDYSIYIQQGDLTTYGSEAVESISEYNIGLDLGTLIISSPYPSSLLMAMITKFDADASAPSVGEQYTAIFDTPVLKVSYQ